MQTATVQSTAIPATSAAPIQQGYPPLGLETRTVIPTNAAAFYLNRQPQTLRAWACLENGPVRPLRINGRLAWPVAAIKQLLSGGAQ